MSEEITVPRATLLAMLEAIPANLARSMRVELPSTKVYGSAKGSLLHLACIVGSEVSARSLLNDTGLPLLDHAEHYGTPLHCAARFAHVEVMQVLLSHHSASTVVNEMVPSYDNEYPLQCVAAAPQVGGRSTEAAQLLISAGARLDIRDGAAGDTALARAIRLGNRELAHWLLTQHPTAQHGDSDELLRLAADRMPDFIEPVVSRLGADVNKTRFGHCVIMMLVMSCRVQVDSQPSREAGIRELLRLRADPAIKNGSGDTPLQKAMEFSLDDAIVALLQSAEGASGGPGKRARLDTAAIVDIPSGHVEQLVSMGFGRDQAERALRSQGGDLNGAIEALL